jgi:aminoglycoside phosphotransferase (APT) family kinase protein
MHGDEVETDAGLVRRLLIAQFPHWAELPIDQVPHPGTDHAIYRLGENMSVRLPRIGWATGQVDKDFEWLPRLAPHLPLSIPVPLAKGEPGEGFPWHWSVSPWLEGRAWTDDGVGDLSEAAIELAGFILALQRIDSSGGPLAGEHNFFRGVPLADRDAAFRQAVPAWGGIVDTRVMLAAWDEALRAPVWDRPAVWVHGDLSRPGNLLVANGHLSAVIDFGCLGVGDPACDVRAAWSLFSGESREAFRAALAVDAATWMRARGWALTSAGALPYYRDTNPLIVAEARHAIEEVVADYEHRSG